MNMTLSEDGACVSIDSELFCITNEIDFLLDDIRIVMELLSYLDAGECDVKGGISLLHRLASVLTHVALATVKASPTTKKGDDHNDA